jgi:hypothetical protein
MNRKEWKYYWQEARKLKDLDALVSELLDGENEDFHFVLMVLTDRSVNSKDMSENLSRRYAERDYRNHLEENGRKREMDYFISDEDEDNYPSLDPIEFHEDAYLSPSKKDENPTEIDSFY